MKEMFKDFIVHSSDVEEIACVEVIEIVKKLSSVSFLSFWESI
jgi:hypothetical protein